MSVKLKWWEAMFTLQMAEGSPAASARGVEKLVPLLMGLAYGLLLLGIALPVFNVTKLFIFTDYVSIWSGVIDLIGSGDYFIAAVIIIFSIVFPIGKLMIADYVWRCYSVDHPNSERSLKLLDWVGKWSMLDILVVAIIVFAVKASGLADASTQPGVYCFAGAVITSAIAVSIIKRVYKRSADSLLAIAA